MPDSNNQLDRYRPAPVARVRRDADDAAVRLRQLEEIARDGGVRERPGSTRIMHATRLA